MIQGGKQLAARFTHTRSQGSSGGFTIVETLIVLAVTGALFVSAALLISGRQNKTEFQTSINNLQQQIQQVINETASGYYPNNGNFVCKGRLGQASTDASSTGVPSPLVQSGANAQGTNRNCIFLGKAFRFGGAHIPTLVSNYTVYPMVGNRLNSTGDDVNGDSAFIDAYPIVIGQGTSSGNWGSVPNSSALTTQLDGGLTFVYASYNGGGRNSNVAAFAVLSRIDQYGYSGTGSGAALQSGTQQFGLYSFNSTPNSWSAVNSAPNPQQTVVDTINGNDGDKNASGKNLIPRDTVQLCFASGTTNQSGLITIGSNGGLAVSLAIKDGQTC